RGRLKRLSPLITVGTEPTAVSPDGALHLMQTSRYDGVFVFGDGTHPTTRLCAAAVDLLCRQQRGLAVLDVGTGTGVLARIARARGASFVAATDTDASALQLARDLAAIDGASVPIHFGREAPDHWGARFELVVANILEAPLIALAPALAAALKPGGTLLISGFTRAQAPTLRLVFSEAGLNPLRDAASEGWLLLEFTLPQKG
ncbi:MAG: 50S ribosomal protein L11 methyltransferase, partial [Steroidobacteraceae bacterium]